jgi:hypothetical protein
MILSQDRLSRARPAEDPRHTREPRVRADPVSGIETKPAREARAPNSVTGD